MLVNSIRSISLYSTQISTETQEVSMRFEPPMNQTFGQMLRSVFAGQSNSAEVMDGVEMFRNLEDMEEGDDELFSDVITGNVSSSAFARIAQSVSFHQTHLID